MGEDKPQKTDFDLLAEFNAGSEEAFSRIVERHAGPLINFLHRYTLNRAESEDIAQEAFLKLYKAAPGLRPEARLSTILYKIAYHLAVDRARRLKSRAERAPTGSLDAAQPAGEPAEPAAETPDAIYEAAQASGRLAAGLARLPETQRLALLLRAYEGRSYAEIAEILDLSVASVESLLFRARQSLARLIK